MSIFDGILNTEPQKRAAADQIQGITAGNYAATNNLTQGQQNTNADFAGGLDAILSGGVTAANDFTGAKTDALGRLDTTTSGVNAILGDTGAAANNVYDATKANAGNYFTAGLDPFMTNLKTDQAGQDAYADATGVNGATGYARALDNFHAGPGYQFLLDQGTQAALRGASGAGTLASGGTLVDLQNMGQGLANQQWSSYLSSLQPFLGQSTANAQGAAGVNTTAGTTAAGIGTAQAGTTADLGKTSAGTTAQLGGQGATITGQLGQTAGTTAADLAKATGSIDTAKAGIDTGFANKLADLNYQSATGIGNANANKDLAKTGADANIVNAFTGAAPAIGQAAGQFGSSLASGLSAFMV